MSSLRTVEDMLERQGRFWELRRRLAQESGETLASLPEGPWITISRQIGAGGRELARRLAHELGWQAFDQEIIKQIAEHTHTRETVLSRLDERALGPINDYLGRVLDPNLPGRAPFVQEMVRVIWSLARQGNAIIVGRGANWFLDPRHGVRVRLVAPLEVRVARVARAEGLDQATAERRVRLGDEGQTGFIRQVYDRDIDDPLGYDVVVNTATLPMAAIEAAVLSALRQRRAGAPDGGLSDR